MRAKHRAKVDDNQMGIVKIIRSYGVSVETGHDDIICGWRGASYWFEIKDRDKLFLKDGTTIAKNAIKPSQIKLLESYQGHYAIVWSANQILTELGIVKNPYDKAGVVSWDLWSPPITRENLQQIVIGK